MNFGLESGISRYKNRRDRLVKVIADFKDWMAHYTESEPDLLMRIYDLTENLKGDRLMLAFVAEFSRGKTELINALFFSDFKQRLLPSDAGRTTMCPTEIYYDAGTEPYIRLLPIETRFRDDSITRLLSGKNQQIIGQLREKMITDKQNYDVTMRNFNVTRKIIGDQGHGLLARLDDERLEKIIAESMLSISES